MNLVKKFQDRLIAKAQNIYYKSPLSAEVIKAFYEVPRHKFVKRYRVDGNEWLKISDDNLKDHLADLYDDIPLVLYGDSVSTISQPSFVLKQLDLLQLKKGHRVFEVGTGSGWNAGLIGYLVGSEGIVVTVEIIHDLVANAKKVLKELKLNQVKVFEGDAGEGNKEYAPYDRAIFTAGAYDLPHHFFEQIKTGGLLLFILKNDSGERDTLLLLEKKENYFESVLSSSCGFVPMTGQYQVLNADEKMPNLSNKKVRIFSKDQKIKLKPNERVIKRNESQFVWLEA